MAQKLTHPADTNFFIKNLDNHIQRYVHSLYNRKDFQDCSLMNMWVSDFLYNNQEREIYQKDVEAEFFINRATASKMLHLMEKKELIRRIPAPEDARLKTIRLLPKGYELHQICTMIKARIEEKLTKDLSPEEVALFHTLCRKMIANMEA